MLINKSYKVELNPTLEQIELLKKSVGTVRFVWNWGLEQINKGLIKPNGYELSKAFNKIKDEQYPWVREVSKDCCQQALLNLGDAFNKFFKSCKNKDFHFKRPKFKVKGQCRESFTFCYHKKNEFKVKNNTVNIPRVGYVKLKQIDYIPLDCYKYCFSTVSYRANKWFISVCVEEDIAVPDKGYNTIGIDLGINKLATLSDGTTYENPKALKKHLKQLRKLNKRLARQEKGSKRWEKTKQRISKLYYRISNIRSDNLHKITAEIVRTKHPEVIVIEDLAITNMIKNKRLSRDIGDVSFGEFKRQLEYKCKWNNVTLVKADRFFPSSKLCSNCGNKKSDLKLSDRVYKCEVCSYTEDRDLNAALNLMSVGSTANAHGEAMLVKEPLRSEKIFLHQ